MASNFSTVGAANRTPVSSFKYEDTPLQHAKKLGEQKNARKWICIATLIFLIIIAIIVVGTNPAMEEQQGFLNCLTNYNLTVSHNNREILISGAAENNLFTIAIHRDRPKVFWTVAIERCKLLFTAAPEIRFSHNDILEIKNQLRSDEKRRRGDAINSRLLE